MYSLPFYFYILKLMSDAVAEEVDVSSGPNARFDDGGPRRIVQDPDDLAVDPDNGARLIQAI